MICSRLLGAQGRPIDTQQVRPLQRPVVGELRPAQQFVHQAGPPIGPALTQEVARLGGRGQGADDVEIHPPQKFGVVGQRRRFDPVVLPAPGHVRIDLLGQRLFDLFHYLRWETSVPTKLNECAILIIGRQWRSQVEWFAHAPLAAKAGLKADIIAELKESKRPSGMAEDEAVVYDFVTELTTTQKVSDETFARAKKVFNDQQIVDLTAVAGNYVMVAMMLAMSETTVPPGKEEPFKE